MSNQTLTRRELTRWAMAGAAGVLLTATTASTAQAQVVDPLPVAPPPLPNTPVDTPIDKPINEGDLLTQLVPINVGYALTDTQATEVRRQLKDYPGAFAKARAYVLPDEIGPAFAADAPPRKETTQ